MQCAELIGFYVNPEIWTSFVLPAVRTSAGCRREDGKRASDVTVGPVQSTSCVLVLAGLVRGATRTSIEPYFKVCTACACVRACVCTCVHAYKVTNTHLSTTEYCGYTWGARSNTDITHSSATAITKLYRSCHPYCRSPVPPTQ